MAKILVLYYSTYGHVETMASSIADGVREFGGDVDIRRVPELVPADVAEKGHFKLDQAAPFASVGELPNYDAIVVGTPTRYGRLSAQMADFWDQTGGLWAEGKLVGKLGAAFTSTATQHGGQETTLLSVFNNFFHHGMLVTGLPYSFKGMLGLDEVAGGTPYGASTIAAGDGSRQVSDTEKAGAHFLGGHVAKLAAKLAA